MHPSTEACIVRDSDYMCGASNGPCSNFLIFCLKVRFWDIIAAFSSRGKCEGGRPKIRLLLPSQRKYCHDLLKFIKILLF